MSRVNQAKTTVSRAISTTETKIKDLTAELQEQLNMIPPDQAVISDLEKSRGGKEESYTAESATVKPECLGKTLNRFTGRFRSGQ